MWSFSSMLPNACLWSSKRHCEERDCKTPTRSEAKMEKLFLQHQKILSAYSSLLVICKQTTPPFTTDWQNAKA